ncbi:MAG TPA: helix-turn-helix domain-containing protein [Candidatus Saccharimonadales bacterium]|nr:helix-turn-helix domain-containing protein [Candidatus Saccharimonadales bacterium]
MNGYAELRSYLGRLGMPQGATIVYIALLRGGAQSILQLSRATKLERTKVYRLIDSLRTYGLIEIEEHYKRRLIRAAPVTNLYATFIQKEEEIASLKRELYTFKDIYTPALLSTTHMRVQLYEGNEGIRQALWNELRAKDEIVGYNYRILEEAAGKKYTSTWAEVFARRKLTSRLVVGDEFVDSWQDGLKGGRGTGKKVIGIQYHYLPRTVFPITHSCDIYDDVVVYFQWYGNEIIAVEIYNRQIANIQRHFFETLWEQSTTEERL